MAKILYGGTEHDGLREFQEESYERVPGLHAGEISGLRTRA